MKKLKKLTLLALLPFAACVSSPQFEAYVRADRLHVDTMVVLSERLIADNPSMVQADKDTLIRGLEAKKRQVDDAEKLLGIK